MPNDQHSIYHTKAHLSRLLKQVKGGRAFTITDRGRPIARVVPHHDAPQTFAERIRELTDRGIVRPAVRDKAPVQPIKHVAGALQRFLKDRSRY